MEITTDNNERITHLYGNVIIKSDKLLIQSNEAFFHNTKGYIVIKGNLNGKMDKGNFVCDSLLYYIRKKESVLNGNAAIESNGAKFRSDRFIIEHSNHKIFSNSGIEVIDTEQDFTVIGKEGQYDYSADTGFVYGEPYIKVRDSVFIYSDTFFVYRREQKVTGRNNVKVKFTDGEVKGKKIKYIYNEGYGFISDSVRIIKGNVISTMDTLYFYGKEQGIDSLYMKNSVQMEANLEEGDKVKINSGEGKVYIKDSRMQRIVFLNNPQGIYYPASEKE